MRADFYHRLAEHPELRSLVASQQVLLGPLERAACGGPSSSRPPLAWSWSPG